jgi:PAS domain S-box-containing protein
MPSPLTAISRILLIDDNPGDVLLLRETLADEPSGGFRIVADTATLERGVALMASLEIDLVLLDLTLPDSSGIETFTTAHRAAPHLPIIVLTGQNDEELALHAVHLGAEEYLVKGAIDSRLLVRTLRYALERSHYQQALARERDFFTTLLDNIPDRIYFKDEKSRFIRINRALTRLFQLARPEEAYGKTDADFYGAEHAQDALADERRVMETGEPLLNKVEYETMQDGTRAWSLTTKLPLRDRKGRIVGTCGISREVTQLKEMEGALESERNLLRAVIDNVPDHIFLKDAEGRYLLDNVAHMRWLGAAHRSEIVGRTPFDFFPEEVARQYHEADLPVLQSGRPVVNNEEKSVDAYGNTHWALLTKVPWITEDGRVHGMVCLKRDITEQKLAEEHLKQANAELATSREEVLTAMGRLQAAHTELRDVQLQLIEAEKMKLIGRLAAGVAHEVKNPLAILKMGVDFLNQQPSDDETTRIIIKEMDDAVLRADSVIRGLLDFSRPKQLEKKKENLNALLEDALKLVKVEMKGAFDIVRELDPRLPEVALDKDKISHVFVNLMTNAIHAMGDGGTLTVRTYSKQLTGVGQNIAGSTTESFRVGQAIVLVEIDDTGHGVPEDKLAKIFEPFFTTKPTGKGTGLGLAVVKTIIDLHGATIDIRNLHDAGARATIMFQA